MSSIVTRMLSLGSIPLRRDLHTSHPFARDRVGGVICVATLGIIVAGCSGGSSVAVKAGPISIATTSGATGQAKSLTVASTVKLSMIPSGDSINAGVDWTVTCGGNPVTGSITNGACGTLAPAHTADGATTVFTAPAVIPIGNTVTITGSVTSNPSQRSSVSFTILPPQIAVSFTNPIPSSLPLKGTLVIGAQATNDLANGGISWTVTCGTSTTASACGSFDPTVTTGLSTTYTAPATTPPGGTVTITATSLTDTSKSANVTIAIGGASGDGPIAINLSPASFYVQTAGAAHAARLNAIVTNDALSAGVDWSISCGASNCGTFTGHTASGSPMTFSGPTSIPPGGIVTITAKSTSAPTVSATSIATVVTAAPIVVTIPTASQPPPTLAVGSQTTLSATVSGTLGVDWAAVCGSTGACGTFNLSPAHTTSGAQIVYTAPSKVPAGGVVTIIASSPVTTPANSATAMTTIIAKPPSLTFAQAAPTALVAEMRAPISAVVTNDVAPGGVTWTVQCGSAVPGGCGAIVPYQTASGGVATYTAPPVTSSGTTVTINAASTADPKVSISSTPIAINPSATLSVNFIPSAPSQIQAESTMNLTAAVVNDSTNAGADWQVCASGCGFFTTKPAIPAVPATTTTPFIPAVPAVTETTAMAWPNNLPLPYTAPSQPPPSGSVVVLVTAHADTKTANAATVAITSTSNGPALHGIVQAGTEPVVGASVALYAAGTSGYASVSSQISAPGGATAFTTDKDGSFVVPAGYNCPQPNSQMYLVATGGQVGTNTANPNLAMMTALRSCSGLSSASVVLNEVTSIASAFSTAPFAANDALNGTSSYLYLGTSSGNVIGLANAFAAVNNLVDISTGQARFTVPSGNATVPYVQLNTLANILNACTASSGGLEGDGSNCSTLFTATDVLAAHADFNSRAPTDTLQAAFNIAQHPITNYGYSLDTKTLFALATLASPFQPILTAQPGDWSIALNYTGGGGLSASSTVGSFAVDAVGNLWITDTRAGSVIEWNAVGAALSPSTGFPAGGGPIAVDATGNVWISGDGSLTELTSLGSPVLGSPFGGVAGGGGDLSFDAQSNLWITNSGGVNEFNNLGLEISPASGYTNSGLTGILPIAVDSSNNIWEGNIRDPGKDYVLAELTNPGGQFIVVNESIYFGFTAMSQIAADGSGGIWTPVAGAGGVCRMPPYGGKGTTLVPTCYPGVGSAQGAGFFVQDPQGIALDGAGIAWVASKGGGNSPIVLPGVTPISPSLVSSGVSFFSSTLSAGPLRLAIDGSGNVWVLLADNTVTEYVGLATPVVTPIALGAKNKKLAAKP